MKKPAIALVLTAVLLMSSPFCSWAASGGRMGGRTRSSYRSSASSSRSSSYRSSYIYDSSSSSSRSSYGSSSTSLDFDMFLVMVAVVFAIGFVCWLFSDYKWDIDETTTVLKLQVGLLGSARSLQRDLNEIARTTNASTPKGLSYILTETTFALLRHPEYFISAFSSIDLKTRFKDSEKRFNKLLNEERGKLDEETLVNVNNIRRQRPFTPFSKKDDGISNEYMVITILVEAEGFHKLPTINGCKDLEDALQKLGSILSSQIRAVEVIWTPQAENDTLLEKQVHEDYPLLNPISWFHHLKNSNP